MLVRYVGWGGIAVIVGVVFVCLCWCAYWVLELLCTFIDHLLGRSEFDIVDEKEVKKSIKKKPKSENNKEDVKPKVNRKPSTSVKTRNRNIAVVPSSVSDRSVLVIDRLGLTGKQRLSRHGMIKGGEFVYWEDYIRDWIIDGPAKRGYHYNNDPGCYIILIFNKEVKNGDYRNYENVYVGQSARVCNRVHNHLIGKGNGDVYADAKFGKKVYVKLIFCDRVEMNDVEKTFIELYDATSSYNGTKGGSTDWVEKEKRKGV